VIPGVVVCDIQKGNVTVNGLQVQCNGDVLPTTHQSRILVGGASSLYGVIVEYAKVRPDFVTTTITSAAPAAILRGEVSVYFEGANRL
jgi:hypothetical protein